MENTKIGTADGSRARGPVFLGVAILAALSLGSALEAQERKIALDDRGRVVRWSSDAGEAWSGSSAGELEVFFLSGREPRQLLAEVLGGRRGFIGLHMTEITPELRAHFGAPRDAGVLVSRLSEAGPAERAGVRVGDVVVAVDGRPVLSESDVGAIVRPRLEGDRVDLELWRQGERRVVPVTVRRLEPRALAVRALPDGGLEALPVGEHDPEALEELEHDLPRELDAAMARALEYFRSEDWRQQLRRLEEVEWRSLERRIRELESRLLELEQEAARRSAPP